MAPNLDEKTQFFWLLFVVANVSRISPIFLHSNIKKNKKNEKMKK